MNTRRVLGDLRAPDEPGAEQRAWAVVGGAYRDRSPVNARRSRLRIAFIPVLVVVAGAVTLSPAGATVARWVKDAFGVPHAARALFSLPAPGKVLVSGPGGTWSVSADGSARRLGSWSQASWSPHGLYVAVARSDELAAVDPRGTVRWSVSRRLVADPSWYPPSGYRVAYLSGHTLRIVAGDGTGDRRLATGVAAVAPAWRPGHPYQLAYLAAGGRVVVRDADTGNVAWTATPPGRIRALAWSEDGRRLLALTPTQALLYAFNGQLLRTMAAGGQVRAGSLSPDGQELALIRAGAPGRGPSARRSVDQVVLANLASTTAPLRPVFSGPGIRELAWSPNDRWLLVSWPPADQWVFVRVAGKPRIAAVSHIAQQFGASRLGSAGFPRLQGWCCSRWP